MNEVATETIMGLKSCTQVLVVLSLARAATAFEFQSVAAIAPFLHAELGYTPQELGLLIGIFMFPGLVVALPGGLMGARFGDKRVACIAGALIVTGGLGLALLPGFSAACMNRVLSGIGAALFNVVVMKMMCDWFARNGIQQAMAVFMNAWPIGIGLAFAVLPLTAASLPLSATLAVPVLVAAVSFLLLLAVYREAPQSEAAMETNRPHRMTAKERLLAIIASCPWMFYAAGLTVLIVFAPLHLLAQQDAMPGTSGLGIALNSVAVVAFGQLGGAVVHRTGRANTVVYGGFLCALLATAALVCVPQPVFWLTLVGAGAGLGAGVLSALPSEILHPGSRSVGMGIFYTVYYLGLSFFPPLAGRLVAWAGTPAAAIVLAGALFAACVAFYAVFRFMQGSHAHSLKQQCAQLS